MTAELLEIRNLTVAFEGQDRPVLDAGDLQVPSEGWMGLVGESGSGKSITSLAVLGLLPAGAHVLGGSILMDGEDLLTLPPAGIRAVRGSRIGMIFQSPRSALNPLMPVGAQIARAVRRRDERADSMREAVDLLRKVRIPDPEVRAHAYPHQLSGGMCQRVLIAMMLAARPRLLIADEPTTGLDVTVQAEILDLVHQLQQEIEMAVLLISHDLGIIAEHCRRVAVMHAGHVVEVAPSGALFADPRHPYTAQLMATLLRADRPVDLSAAGRPRLARGLPATGCCYAGRCPHAETACVEAPMELRSASPEHLVACRRQESLRGLSIEDRATGARAEVGA